MDENKLPKFPTDTSGALKKRKEAIDISDDAPDQKRQLLGTLQKSGSNILTAKDDDCDLFGKQIAISLRDLHPYHKDMAKIEILMIINRYKYPTVEHAPVHSSLSNTTVSQASSSPTPSPQVNLFLQCHSVPYSNPYYS
jgi:hypothetical protein